MNSRPTVQHLPVDTPAGSLSSSSASASGIVCITSIPRRPDGQIDDGPIEQQSDYMLSNLKRDLEAAGSSMNEVLHLTIYLTDRDDWAGFNQSYQRHFAAPYPVRCSVGVAWLAAPGMRVEVTAVSALRTDV
jgi:enamine deaminase RidA (YjgF/YER057c/UK114 family)